VVGLNQECVGMCDTLLQQSQGSNRSTSLLHLDTSKDLELPELPEICLALFYLLLTILLKEKKQKTKQIPDFFLDLNEQSIAQ